MAATNLIEKTLRAWNSLPFDKLEEDTVKYFWDNAFADVNEIGNEVSRDIVSDFDDFQEKLLSVYDVCISWIEESRQDAKNSIRSTNFVNVNDSSNLSLTTDDCSSLTSLQNGNEDTNIEEQTSLSHPVDSRCELWEVLTENDIPVKKIMTLLYVMLNYGNSKPVSNEKKALAFLNARIYLSLLRIPGSSAFRLFQSNIFAEVLNALRIPMGIVKDSRPKNYKGAKNRKKRGRNVEVEDRSISPDQDAETEGSWDISKSYHLIADVLDDFAIFLKTVPMKSHPLLVDSTVNTLVMLTQLETEKIMTFVDSSFSHSQYRHTRIGVLGFKTILLMCNSNHGDMHNICCTIMKHFIPSILMSAAGSAQNIQKQFQTVKDNSVEFLKHMIGVVGESSFQAARILLQQISTRSPDRAEFRTKIAQSVIALLECFPKEKFDSMIEWFHQLLKTPRTNTRIFGLELFSFMIADYQGVKGDAQLSGNQCTAIIKNVLDRCNDKSPSVRSKALSIVAHFFEEERHGPEGSIAANGVLDAQFVEMLRNRCCDEKVNVRKSSIQVLQQVMCLDRTFFTKENLDFMKVLCRDIGLLARKQALQSLTSCLLANPTSVDAQKYWVQGIFPAIVDRETSMQEKCIEAVNTVLFQNLARTPTNLDFHEMAFEILNRIADGEQEGYQPYLKKIIQMWVRNGMVRPNIVADIKQMIDGHYNGTAWLLLAELSSCFVIRRADFVLNYWENNKSHLSVTLLHRVLQTLLHVIKQLYKPELCRLRADLIYNLKTFRFPSGLISIAVNVVEKLEKFVICARANDPKWYAEILDSIENFLKSSVKKKFEQLDADQEEEFTRHLFMLGVLSQISGSVLTKKHYSLVQTIANSGSSSFQQPLSDVTPSQVPNSQANLQFVTVTIQAYAYSTLGKLCLINEGYAKQNIIPLVTELHQSQEETIRNNVLIIMSDLCIRYPALVDPYINDMTACLRDKSVFVRKQVLSLLARLLQEDYIKCRGPFFYRLLVSYVDDFDEIRELAEFVLVQVLLTRNTLLFYQHFVESIFFLNCYKGHRVYNKFDQTDDEAKLFALIGTEKEEKRSRIYKLMLENMDDENKFRLNLRLCQEILAAVTDEVIPLSPTSTGIIQDALRILCSDEIKLSSLTSSQDEAEEDLLAAVAAQTKKTIISQVVKNNIIENIVPTVVNLKKLFEKKNSPLLRDLMLFLRELFKDYKNEIKEIITDKQLAKEIEFDMKKFAEEEERRRRQLRVNRANPRPTNGAPEQASANNSVQDQGASNTEEQFRVPIKPENRSHSARPNSSMDIDTQSTATISRPVHTTHVEKKPQYLVHPTTSNTQLSNSNEVITLRELVVSITPINPATIKRTISCEEVVPRSSPENPNTHQKQ